MKTSAIIIVLGCCLLGLLVGCSAEAEEISDPFDHVDAEGTEKMVRVLQELNQHAYENPTHYFYLNSRIAEVYREMLTDAPEGEEPVVRYNYAWQLLKAGETEAAIDHATQVISRINASPERMNPQSKPLFDLLALAYLRLGEEQNCIHNPTAKSCILPIADEGVHQLRQGSERAAEIYFEIQRHFPRDLESRWLLNIAHMTLGDYPEGVHERFRIHGLADHEDNSIPAFEDKALDLGIAHEALAGGVSVEDFTGNGLLDILVTSYGLVHQVRFYENNGEGGFEDRTEEAGLKGIVGGLNTVHADYNNSGYADILILRGAWLGDSGEYPNSLLRNNGDGTFTDVTYEAGLASYHPTQTGAWGDFTGNGYVDLFVGNESGVPYDAYARYSDYDEDDEVTRRSELYLNNGDGTFSEVSADVGVDIDAYVKGATWCDVNNSGLPDLYVSVLGGENLLFVNQGGSDISDWLFEEQAAEAGVHDPHYSFTTWCWDMDNDGHEDLFVSGYDVRMLEQTTFDVAAEYMNGPTRGTTPRVYRNSGDGTFVDTSGPVNLDKVMYTMGANFGDLTGNGYLDFYVGTGAPDLKSLIPNRAFFNRDGRYFDEVTLASGLGHIQKGHGAAINDFTNDGSRDIYMVMGGAVEGDVAHNVLFKNPGRDTRWLNLRLEGTSSNRAAIGARIRVDITTEDGQEQSFYRTVSTGGSFGAQSVRQDMGLANASHIDRVEINWPGGASRQVFENINLDSHVLITEGKDQPEYLDLQHIPFRTEQVAHQH